MEPSILFSKKLAFDRIIIKNSKLRQLTDTAIIKEKVDLLWEETLQNALKKGKKIWNGQNLRLDSFNYEISKNSLVLSTSQISFKDRFCRENFHDELSLAGASYTAQGIAIGGLMRTSDENYVFAELSQKYMNESKVDLIGGIVENTQIQNGIELLNEYFREIKEEANVDQNDIQEVFFSGLLQNANGGITIVVNTKLYLDSTNLVKKFELSDKEEVSSLCFVKSSKLKDFLNELGGYKSLISNLS
jgi:hypothetical protein